MSTYFHGWRRKIGVVSLFLACVYMAGWVRSLTDEDCFCRVQRLGNTELISADGSIGWRQVVLLYSNTSTSMGHPANGYSRRKSRPIQLFPIVSAYHKWDSDLDFRFAGFAFVSALATWNDIRSSIWIIPYWSIVLPLTLLSAWLLLSPPRKRSTVDLPE